MAYPKQFRRNMALIVARTAIIVLVSGVGSFAIVHLIDKQIESLQTKRGILSQLEHRGDLYRVLREDRAVLREALPRITPHLPAVGDIVTFVSLLETTRDGEHLSGSFSYSQPVPAEVAGLVALDFEATVSGSSSELQAFLASLEHFPQVVETRGLAFTFPSGFEAEGSMKFSGKTFFKE